MTAGNGVSSRCLDPDLARMRELLVQRMLRGAGTGVGREINLDALACGGPAPFRSRLRA